MTLDELKAFARSPQFAVEIEDVFFDAMNAGYVTNAELDVGSIAELAGSKMTKFVRDRWTVMDVWHTTPISPFSGGTTHIWYGGVEVWMMQYYGSYPDDAIPCLKAALRATYSSRKFCGGRGLDRLPFDDLVYRNPFACTNIMEQFDAQETIFRGVNIVGRHHYRGGCLI